MRQTLILRITQVILQSLLNFDAQTGITMDITERGMRGGASDVPDRDPAHNILPMTGISRRIHGMR